MSDTLLEPEGQISEHQVTKSGTCVIPGCPCRGWSAQEAAGAKEVAEYHPPTLIDAAKGIEQWWLEQGMHAFSGAPPAMFDLRAAIADYDEHQSATQGGGDERLHQIYQRVDDGYRCINFRLEDPYNLSQRLEDTDYLLNQHQSLMAERERLRESLADMLSIVEDEGHVSNYIPQVTAARKILAETALTNVANQQRSTSE